MPFKFLILFTIFLFLRPQDLYPPLATIPFAKIIAFAGLFSFFISKTNNIPQIFKTKEFKLLIALIVLIIITSPFGLWPGGSFNRFFSSFIQVFLIFLLIAGTVDSLDKVTKLLWIIVLCGTVIAIISILDYMGGEVFMENRLRGREGLYGDPNELAVSLVMAISFAIYLFKVNQAPIKRVILIVTFAIGLTNIILTYSRTGIIALGVLSLGLIIKSKRRIRTFVILMLIMGSIIALAPNRFQDRVASIFIAEKNEDGSRSDRIEILGRGIEIFLENPISGVGLGNFAVAEGMKKGVGHWMVAHNGYLEIAAELGIFGFLIFLGLLYLTIKNFRNMQKVSLIEGNSADFSCLFQMLELALWVYIVSNFFLSTEYSWVLFYLIGFSLALKLQSAKVVLSDKVYA